MKINLRELRKGCAKALLLVLNAFCILLSFGCFGFAIVDMRILKQYGLERAAGTFLGDVIIMAASLTLVAIAIFGCVGAVRENVKILYLYTCLLMTLVLLELLIGIFVTLQRCGLDFKVTDWLRDDFYGNWTGPDLRVHDQTWDDLQLNYECCGLNGPDDYPALLKPMPLSCCPRAFRARTPLAQEQLFKACVEAKTYFSAGCEDEILYYIRADGDFLLGVAVISFCCEAAGMLLAMWIANNLKNSVQVYQHTVKY